ncbi:MAG: hydrogenase 3 maturation endopeptidase HyCI [Candidatus Omnitrophota bacterium]
MTLENILKGTVVIVGIGNILRGDDGFGPALVSALKGRTRAVLIDAGVSPENCTGLVKKAAPDTVVLVDAVHMDLEPGECRILGEEDILKTGFSTHDASQNMFMQYLKSETGARIYMLGLQPATVALGSGMTEKVSAAVPEIADKIEGILNA